MTAEKNKVVTVKYSLSAKDEKMIGEKFVEKTSDQNPLVFIFGIGHLLPDFENNLLGKKVGDSFDFQVKAEKGYGLRDEKYVIDIPIDSFKKPDGTIDLNQLKVGNIMPMSDNNGNKLYGKVLQITPQSATLDFNHELAGMDLHFSGEIISLRDASAEEIS